MTTEALIQHLRQLMPLGPQISMLVNEAADRLEELHNNLHEYYGVIKEREAAKRERDDARAEVERLKQELTEAIRERNKTVVELIKQRDEERAHNEFTFTRRPEPSRLEIAAQFMVGSFLGAGEKITNKQAFKMADALIAAAKEGK